MRTRAEDQEGIAKNEMWIARRGLRVRDRVHASSAKSAFCKIKPSPFLPSIPSMINPKLQAKKLFPATISRPYVWNLARHGPIMYRPYQGLIQGWANRALSTCSLDLHSLTPHHQMPKPLTDKSAFEESMVWVQRVPSFNSHCIKFHPCWALHWTLCMGFEDSTPFSEYLDDFSSGQRRAC